jgi:hypothetical protein
MPHEAIAMVDDLFAFCAETGFIGGRQENNQAIIFEMVDRSEVRLELAGAQGTFRTMCARMCKISNDLNPALDNIYFGGATMPYGTGAIQIECENRLAKHYFKLKYLANQATAGDCAVTSCLQAEHASRAAPERQRSTLR